MWVRGLKLFFGKFIIYCGSVAPHVGAWIETSSVQLNLLCTTVAPHVGAWIETIVSRVYSIINTVAPHVGAWIETIFKYLIFSYLSRTPCGCVD